jgi:redox-sensitive bicupin YhaK (pirin superfamily)
MDPLLMVDELRSEHREDFAAGFPPHPHRGMQTLTYMKHGGIVHEDSLGNRGEIRGGGAQWMSAGRGVIHSEMPTQDSHGLHGFQLWVNLPAADKMAAPRYRDVPRDDLTHLAGPGFEATLIAGDWALEGRTGSGPLAELAERAALADLSLAPGAKVVVEAGPAENVIAYIYDGSLVEQGRDIAERHLLVTGPGEQWSLFAGSEGAKLLIVRGEPIGEPVAHYGPFVMNTPDEIEQALADYQAGRFAESAA